jgi:signal recognition particle subunit SEC65
MIQHHSEVIYPSYLDPKKTVKEGRRLPSGLWVPTQQSRTLLALQTLGETRPATLQGIRDCQDPLDNPGRVKVSVSTIQQELSAWLQLFCQFRPPVSRD